MKKILYLMIAGVFVFDFAFGQENFKWEKSDTISKTKSQLYSNTKMFIAENWKSAKTVIENDDKEAGIIFLKGITIKNPRYFNQNNAYTYAYSVTFRMKDGKYKICIDNVYCESATMAGIRNVTKIEPFDGDNCPKTDAMNGGISKNKAIQMMTSLKQDFQLIVNNYQKYISSTNNDGSNW